MRVIDSHVHLYPPEVNRDPAAWAAAAGEPHWAVMCARVRKSGRPVQGFPSVDELLRELDAAGIARAVLLGWYWNRPETCALQNRFYAECVRRHPDRLSACATIHPGAGVEATLAEMRRARDDGLIALGELSPHSQGVGLDDPAWTAALALAGEWGWAVNLHVTDPDSRPYPGRVETPLADFVRLARAFPRVAFVFAHWGALLPLRDPEVLAWPNVAFDTAASPLLYGAEVWMKFLAAVRAERVLFGSDHPLDLYPRGEAGGGLGRFVAEARAGGAGATVLGDNAARLFRLPE
jgi:predicted TIM-barrel fold metal-dependent hydrolase